ncbi:polysaccharide deacetylase family protein [Herbidospora yilanensis]|uniref:polysaccharide deacetylase family protein n=1 Tax=Herbidospora yilanensis TaxID=354426 RepID=UPI000783C71D|nr:polysaccharide deacetylase family protein [Herbidospora yilanensis]
MRRAFAIILPALVLSACSAPLAAPPPPVIPPPEPAAPSSSPSPSPTPSGLPRPGEVRRMKRDGFPVISSVPTERNVVFLTIDDGWEQDPGFARIVRERGIPITVFPTRDAVEARGGQEAGQGWTYVGAGGWPYFKDLGVAIENHTLTHPDLRTLGLEAQKAEICGAAKTIRRHVGRAPELFRPPFGSWNTTTLTAAEECGMRAMVLWTASVQTNARIAYQTPDKRLHPGDILLLHFRPPLAKDFTRLVRKVERRGFSFGDLGAYLDELLPAPS